MLDRDIRPTLLHSLRKDHPGAAIFEEFPVCRKGRADLVAVNSALWGYEIKSERDTLHRLPGQVRNYESVCDFSVIVAAERHVKNAERIIPPHWGVLTATESAAGYFIRETRKPRRNPNRNLDQVIRLLWKTECVKVLRARGVFVSHTESVRNIWDMLREFSISDLDEPIRRALKERRGSGSDLQQT